MYLDVLKLVVPDYDDFYDSGIVDFSMTLLKEEDNALFVLEKTVERKLLGFIKIHEIITETYNGETGIKVNVDKPWWDFLTTG